MDVNIDIYIYIYKHQKLGHVEFSTIHTLWVVYPSHEYRIDVETRSTWLKMALDDRHDPAMPQHAWDIVGHLFITFNYLYIPPMYP